MKSASSLAIACRPPHAQLRQLRHARHRQHFPRHPDHPPLARNAARGQNARNCDIAPNQERTVQRHTRAHHLRAARRDRQRLRGHHLSRRRVPCISPAISKAARWPTGLPRAASTPSSSATGSARTATCCRFRCSTRAAPSRPSAPAPTDYHIDPNRIVVIGFSAGGHLAALAGTQFVPGNPDADDPIDRASSRPDYLVLGYPWLDAITTDTTYLSYCKIFNLMDQCDALRAKYDPILFVTKDTPPTFIYQTFTDKTVSPASDPRLLSGAVQGRRAVGAACLCQRRARQRPGQRRSRARPVAGRCLKLARARRAC